MRPRILLGYSDVAGYFSGLKAALEAAGASVSLVDLTSDPLKFRGTDTQHAETPQSTPWLRRVMPAVRSLGGLLPRPARSALKTTARLLSLPAVVLRNDAVILSGIDMLPGAVDLRVLRWFRRRIIVVFTGSDHRPPYLNGKWTREVDQRGTAWLADETRRLKRRVDAAERWADVIVAHTASAQFHRRPFVRLLTAGLPIAVATAPANAPTDGTGTTVRLLHCPSDPIGKGSVLIRAAVESLVRQGLSVELTEISGRPHAEVLAAISASDMLIDEVYSDTPMGVLAAEAASFEKPTLVAGFLAGEEEEADSASTVGVPPTRFVLPDQLESELAEMVAQPWARAELGRRARAFISGPWAPDAIAERYLRMIEGPVPAEWMAAPTDVRYAFGWGVSSIELARVVRLLIRDCGESALELPLGSPVRERLLHMAR